MKYDKNNPLRVFEAFAGYGSQSLALKRLKKDFPEFDYKCIGYSEIDKYAITAFDALHEGESVKNLGDICFIDTNKLPDFDLFTMSSPCFVAGTLILTEKGYKPIEEVKVGDKVLTHTNRYCSVMKVGNKPSSDIYNIKGMMFDEINCTGNHPFYAREMYRYGHESKRVFRSPEWIEAANLTKKHYLGYAINQESVLPKWDGIIDKRWGHDSRVNKLQSMFDKSDFWYLMGRYVGDGWKKKSKSGKGIIICHSERNKESLYSALDRLGIHYHIQNERTVTKATICMNELFCFVERYGYYAYGKHIDSETLSLPCNLLKAFVDGLLDSDGCYTNNEYKITTVSKELVYGISQCVAKVYHRHCKVNVFYRKPMCVIEGRTVNQRDTYSVSWHIDIRKQDHALYEDGYIWFPISKLQKKEGIDIVYNLEVEGDHSYTANGAIVHNCQDFSSAGKQAGGEEGSGTRSSLLWECSRIIEAKRPKYVLLENVSDLIGKNFVKVFNKWQKRLEGFGYVNFLAPSFPMDWAKKRTKAGILNAKNYGVPQNRERVFMLSIRDDGDKPVYNFPKPFKLEKRLKDILETNVDEKYYLKEDRIKGFDGKRISNHQRGIVKQADDVANAIMNSDYKDAPKVAEIVEPQIVAMRGREAAVLTPKRTEYGKAIRKQYEAHEINEQRKNIQQLEPRTDGLSNTITTVAKDNLVIEPSIMNVGNLYDNNKQAGRIYNQDGICPTLDNMASGGLKQPKIISPGHGYFEGAVNEETCPTIKCSAMQAQHFVSFGYRIRRLTERELYRFMDVDDEDIDVLFKTSIPRTQHAKLAGNSIVVNVLYHIFRKTFIETENENQQLTLF